MGKIRSWGMTVLLALICSAGAWAAPAGDRLEQFVAGFEGLPGWDAQRVQTLRETMAALTPEQRSEFESRLDELDSWEQLPKVMAEFERGFEQRRTTQIERIIEDSTSTVGPSEQVQLRRFRDDLVFLLDQLALFSPFMEASFGADIERLRREVLQVPDAALPSLLESWQKRTSSSRQIIANSMAPPRVIQADGCKGGCGIDVDCWIDYVDCLIDEISSLADRVANLANQVAGYVQQIATFTTDFFNEIGAVFSQIGALPGQIEAFFTSMFGDIRSFFVGLFDQLIAMVPTTPAEALALIESGTGVDFSSTAWITSILNQVPKLEPPCPSADTSIPALGKVGTKQAAFLCERKLEWLTGMLYDIAPSDTYFVPVKLTAAAAYYPINYLCLCVESEAAIAFADAQTAHRTLTEANLDLTLSSRSTQLSVDALNAGLADVTNDVAAVETKLDILEAKLDTLQSNQGDQDQFVRAFRDLLERIEIEYNLLESRPDAVGSFQMPAAFGGLLEKVRGAVSDSIRMSLEAGQNVFGAERELARGDAFLSTGEFLKAFEAYRSAYTEATR